MSPAVVDFSTSITASLDKKQPPSFQNPNPNSQKPPQSLLFDSNNQCQQGQSLFNTDSNAVNSFNLGNDSAGGFNCSFSSGFTRRSRLTFVKVRRQMGSQHGRRRSVRAQNDSGINPFRSVSVSESSNRGEDATTSIPNGFRNFDNVGFVFGVDRSGSMLNSNAEQKVCSESSNRAEDATTSIPNGFRNFDNADFVFGVDRSGSILNSNAEQKVCSESSNRAEDATTSIPNGFRNFDNVDFVFGVDRSGSMLNSNAEQKECSGSVGQLGAGAFGKFDNVGFMFGAKKSNWTSNLVKSECGEIVEKWGAEEFGKSDNLLSANKSNFVLNLNSGNRKLGESWGEYGVDELGKFDNMGFGFGENKLNLNSGEREYCRRLESLGVHEFKKFSTMVFAFDSNLAKSGPSLNSETREPSENVGRNSDETEKDEEDNKSEFVKLDNVDFVFGANCRDAVSNSNLGKKKYSENDGKSVPDMSGKTKLDTVGDYEKVGYAGFVFGTGWSDARSNSNSEKIESEENVGKSVSSDWKDTNSTTRWGKFDNVGFEFGANQNDSASIADSEKGEFGKSDGKLDFLKLAKMNVDVETVLQKAKVDGVFLFGSSSKEKFSFNGSCRFSDGMNSEKDKNCNGYMKRKTDSVSSFENNKNEYNFPFSNGSSLGSAFGESPVFKISDEMQALNILDSEKVDGSNTAKDCKGNSCANVNNMFVFGSNKKTSGSSTGSLGITSLDQFMDANVETPGNGSAAEKISGVDIKAGVTKVFEYVNNEKNCGSFGGSVENMMANEMRNTDSRFGVGVFSGQKPCGISGRENRPTNLTEKSVDGDQFPGIQPNNDSELNKISFPSSSLSMGFGLQPHRSVLEAPPIDRVEKDKFSFTSIPTGPGVSFTGFSTPNLNTSGSFTATLFTGLSNKSEFSVNKRLARGRRLKKKSGKWKQHSPAQQWGGQNHLSKEGSSQKNCDSPGCFSPMDFSPYEDTNCAPSAAHSAVYTEAKVEDLAAARGGSDINEGNNKCTEPNEKGSGGHCGSFVPGFPVQESAFGAEAENINSNTERIWIYSSADVASTESGAGICPNAEREESDGKMQFCFASTSENSGEGKFSLFASSSAEDNLSATKRQYRKKYRMKTGCGSNCAVPSRKVEFASSSVQFSHLGHNPLQLDAVQVQKVDISNSPSEGENISKADEERVKQEPTENQEACEKWRIRGNQAYRSGDLAKAEDCYTRGIDSIPHTKTSGHCIELLVLCYSNRAATRSSLGRVREALGDCRIAATLDPNFLKVHMRAANCHLVLGEVEDALQYFSKCLESGIDVCLDRRTTIEAADGLQKSQKVVECTNRSAELLQQRTSDAASNALGIIAEALSISCYSEKLLEMKGEALCLLRKYEEVVQLCEQTLDFAEKNFATIGPASHLAYMNGSEGKNSFVRLWRWSLMSKSYFHLGRLEVALDLIEKQEQLRSIKEKYGSRTRESSIPLAINVRELLLHKNAGNEAFQFGRHTEAVEHYTAAMSSSVESRPFAAVCFCNRAAAYQALGQITDAVADCSLAIALDGNYAKALSRRATLHEMIRDYEQAANDLQRLASVLEKQSQEKSQQSGTPDKPTGSSIKDLRRARRRLSSMEEKAKNGTPLDLYKILGIKASDAVSEIKKAYRKAALRHHPDKAGQFLARSESGDDGGLWKEITEKIHIDADRLFKMIGEAYAVLSDPSKRSRYDIDEEMRDDEDSDVSSCSGRPSNFYSSPFESSSNRRYWKESWKSYGNSHSHW